MTRDQATASVAALAALSACIVVFVFPPQQYNFYPVCPIYQWTGLLCPGCGATRALHALLHGELFAALSLNPVVVVLSPFIAAIAVWQLVLVARTGRPATIGFS